MPAIQPTKISNVANTALFHPYDIRYGRATLFYSDRDHGWKLPGGAIITSRAIADEKAKQINKMICAG